MFETNNIKLQQNDSKLLLAELLLSSLWACLVWARTLRGNV